MRPAAIALVLCAVVGLCFGMACGALSSSPAAQAAVDCALPAVAKDTIDVVPAVIAILEGGAESWSKMLDGLASAVGRDVLACAILDAETQLAPGKGDATMVVAPTPAIKRAQDYLASHGVRFAP